MSFNVVATNARLFVGLAAFALCTVARAEQPLPVYPGTVHTRIGNDLVIAGEYYRIAYFTTKDSGTGLGLMIVRRIVREHGGEVELQSDEGRGLTVTIRLPTSDRRVQMLEYTVPGSARDGAADQG